MSKELPIEIKTALGHGSGFCSNAHCVAIDVYAVLEDRERTIADLRAQLAASKEREKGYRWLASLVVQRPELSRDYLREIAERAVFKPNSLTWCGQCGQRYSESACGPTHALISMEQEAATPTPAVAASEASDAEEPDTTCLNCGGLDPHLGICDECAESEMQS